MMIMKMMYLNFLNFPIMRMAKIRTDNVFAGETDGLQFHSVEDYAISNKTTTLFDVLLIW